MDAEVGTITVTIHNPSIQWALAGDTCAVVEKVPVTIKRHKPFAVYTTASCGFSTRDTPSERSTLGSIEASVVQLHVGGCNGLIHA